MKPASKPIWEISSTYVPETLALQVSQVTTTRSPALKDPLPFESMALRLTVPLSVQRKSSVPELVILKSHCGAGQQEHCEVGVFG